MTFRVLPEAEGEAIATAVWYDERQPFLGDEFLAAVHDALNTIRRSPESLSRMEQYSGPFDVRRILLERFPYAVIVLCRPEETVVVAVAHTRRRPLYWLERLN
jgi:hypothetical protein